MPPSVNVYLVRENFAGRVRAAGHFDDQHVVYGRRCPSNRADRGDGGTDCTSRLARSGKIVLLTQGSRREASGDVAYVRVVRVRRRILYHDIMRRPELTPLELPERLDELDCSTVAPASRARGFHAFDNELRRELRSLLPRLPLQIAFSCRPWPAAERPALCVSQKQPRAAPPKDSL